MDQFEKFIQDEKPNIFMEYKARSKMKREIFQTIINYLEINLEGKNFLDMGPAYGDSLDICHEKQGNRIDCTDIHPIFQTYNELKPYVDNSYNYNNLLDLDKIPEHTYNVIWNYGAVSVDRFIAINESETLRDLFKNKTPYRRFIFKTNFLKRRNLNLKNWISKVEKLGKKEAVVIICPHWGHKNNQRHVESLEDNFFTKTMKNLGYTMLKNIPKHNVEPEYPVTFYKKLD